MIIPGLVCRDAEAELNFCIKTFGAVELLRRTVQSEEVIHATFMIHHAMVMLHNESSHLASHAPLDDASSSVVTVTYFYVFTMKMLMK